MKEIDLAESKNIMLEIMDAIHLFCNKNNIRYSLAYGSLLGAVRHNGFIPWDDDLDIVMFRSDYEKFAQLFNSNRTDSFKLLDIHNTSDYYLLTPKVIDTRTVVKENIEDAIEIGIWVDIFIVDYLGDDLEKAECMVKNLMLRNKFLMPRLIAENTNRSFYKRCFLKLGKFISKRINLYAYLIKIDKLVSNKTVSKYCGAVDQFQVSSKEIMESEIFNNLIEMEFDGHIYNGLAEYDKYLRHIYGEYMVLPSIEKQISHHDFISYWS